MGWGGGVELLSNNRLASLRETKCFGASALPALGLVLIRGRGIEPSPTCVTDN